MSESVKMGLSEYLKLKLLVQQLTSDNTRLTAEVARLNARLDKITFLYKGAIRKALQRIGGTECTDALTMEQVKKLVIDVVMPLLLEKEETGNWGLLLHRLCKTIERLNKEIVNKALHPGEPK